MKKVIEFLLVGFVYVVKFFITINETKLNPRYWEYPNDPKGYQKKRIWAWAYIVISLFVVSLPFGYCHSDLSETWQGLVGIPIVFSLYAGVILYIFVSSTEKMISFGYDAFMIGFTGLPLLVFSYMFQGGVPISLALVLNATIAMVLVYLIDQKYTPKRGEKILKFEESYVFNDDYPY